jgi:hypothetical protein
MHRLTQDNLQSGNKSALHTDFASTILVYLCEMAPDKQDAEDLLLEVFMLNFHDLLSIRGDVQSGASGSPSRPCQVLQSAG